MKMTIGYTAYCEVEVSVPPEIEEAYRKYQKMWEDYEKDISYTTPYPCDSDEEDKIREWAKKIADRLEGFEELRNVSIPENGEVIYMD